MIDALAATLDVRGRPPRQGDGDHGRGLLLDHPDADPSASLLATGAALFGACDLVAQSGLARSSDTALASVGKAVRCQGGSRPGDVAQPFRGRRHGPVAGCGTRGRTRSGAAATMARMGSCQLRRTPMQTRCLSSCAAAAWKSWSIREPTPIKGSRVGARYFRSTIGHNCLELGGQDQSVSGGPFMWIKSAEATRGCDQRPRARARGGLACGSLRISAAVTRRPARAHGDPPS